jgi:hypothetical protein
VLYKKRKKESSNAIRAKLKKEMTKPRMAESARMAELNIDAARLLERRSTTTRPPS